MKEVLVHIPASTANLGPGFDSQAIALNIHNCIRIRRVCGEAQAEIQEEMIAETARVFFDVSNQKPFEFSCTIDGKVPRARGLGSSATVRLGVLIGLNKLSESSLPVEDLYKVCAKLEEHPDNAAAAAFGGFVITREDLSFRKFDLALSLHFVLLIPDFEVRTIDARRVIPTSIPTEDAKFSATHAAWVAAAFASQDYNMLRAAFKDKLHQPYRKPLLPFLDEVIHAAETAGALGGWLSGSGSTVTCLTTTHPHHVAEAMKQSAPGDSHLLHTVADNLGARLITCS